jgi:hypothetical protein
MGNTFRRTQPPQSTTLPSTPKSKYHQGPSAKVYVSIYEEAFAGAEIDMAKPFDERTRQRLLKRCESIGADSDQSAMQQPKYTLKRARSGGG